VITLADVEAACQRIAGGVYLSPCVESIPLSELTGAHIYCKLDYLQRTGSFKERGARNDRTRSRAPAHACDGREPDQGGRVACATCKPREQP